MSSPVVESVRTIPLIVEQGHRNIPMEIEESSGFPFERESDRDNHFRSQLDDIAKRHPEFAEHLGNFTLRGTPRRQSSLGGTEDSDLPRRFQRPFGGSRFERFGFPFDRDDFNPEQYAQQFYQPQQESHQQQPTYQQQPSCNQSQPEYHQPEYHQPEYHQPEYQQPEQSRQQYSQPQDTESSSPVYDRTNIQQSNTVDLGQKQEPVNERSQRSMSAPPPEKGQRFTSSINIPVNQPNESENMAQTQSPQQAETKTTERIIPIHIEGRSEPVVPKTAPPTYSNSPHPEKIFGQRPENFTQFVNREPRQYEKWHPNFDHHSFNQPEEFMRQQRFPQQQTVPPQYQQQQTPAAQQQKPAPQQQATPQHQRQAQDEIPIPVQVEVPQSKQQAAQQQQQAPQQQPQQQQAPPQPKPAPQQKKALTPIEQIQAIQKDVSTLLSQVEQFTGKPKDKQYLYLDEMLTRNLLKLDNIDTQGQDSIRSARKEAIKCIEKTIGVLEAKAAANSGSPKQEANMEVEEKSQELPTSTVSSLPIPLLAPENKETVGVLPMETEPVTVPVVETNNNKSEGSSQQQQQSMELISENAVNIEDSPHMKQKEENKLSTEESETENQAPIPAPTTLVENKVDQVVGNQVVEPVAENKPVEAPAVEESKMETCESQESNLPVAEAVKKFEGNAEKKEEHKKEENSENKNEAEEKESSQNKESGEVKADDKKGEKKEKKKIKKKVEKKEK